MENKTINAIGAAAAIAVGAAAAGPVCADQIPAAATYADLIAPVSNAASRLDADDAARQPGPAHRAQYNPGGPMSHHHHHHHDGY